LPEIIGHTFQPTLSHWEVDFIAANVADAKNFPKTSSAANLVRHLGPAMWLMASENGHQPKTSLAEGLDISGWMNDAC